MTDLAIDKNRLIDLKADLAEAKAGDHDAEVQRLNQEVSVLSGSIKAREASQAREAAKERMLGEHPLTKARRALTPDEEPASSTPEPPTLGRDPGNTVGEAEIVAPAGAPAAPSPREGAWGGKLDGARSPGSCKLCGDPLGPGHACVQDSEPTRGPHSHFDQSGPAGPSDQLRKLRDDIEAAIKYGAEPEEVSRLEAEERQLESEEERLPEEEVVTGTAVTGYVDRAMYEAEAIDPEALDRPRVHLLSISPDPLGAIAAASYMYRGRVVRDLRELTDEERHDMFQDAFKTALRAPLEFVDLHFMIEGITRAASHQMVRQRTAVYAQESMRFAVKHGIVARPGPLVNDNPKMYEVWTNTMETVWEAYNKMVAGGIPAEEARGLLPHDALTRLHYKTNLRNLESEIGKRLCTQAQFEWRLLFGDLRRAIREHTPYIPGFTDNGISRIKAQYAAIADSPMFQPICFQTGKCMFQSDADRGCTIRERVDRGAFSEIRTEEWAADPTAGFVS